ncbi:MAG: hypothetical protein H6Q04_901, partial [Acidobacteria bacterium]|nr:hypothetical protein [Acidobacteriota bacterium]
QVFQSEQSCSLHGRFFLMAVVAVSHPPLFRFDQSRGHGAARDIDLPGQRNLSAYFLEMGPLVLE